MSHSAAAQQDNENVNNAEKEESSSQPGGDDDSRWIHLQEGKEFSRLLYPNPVCFLATRNPDDGKPNVMVISWLSATNNEGRLMMSLNNRRNTAQNLTENGQEFTLSVPVVGMEDLVIAVGSTSGRFGSKFPESQQQQSNSTNKNINDVSNAEIPSNLSKRQKKKRQHELWAKGIPNLRPVPFGEHDDSMKETSTEIFCIQGTVAHLHCRIYSLTKDLVDQDHTLILAEVIDAFCHADYWDSAKKVFRPKSGAPPYLTFLGSQTFGHVVPTSPY
jgi:flavin reductase (DIM6/NTAB) family NADH-FMN oxidoreductase RutF